MWFRGLIKKKLNFFERQPYFGKRLKQNFEKKNVARYSKSAEFWVRNRTGIVVITINGLLRKVSAIDNLNNEKLFEPQTLVNFE